MSDALSLPVLPLDDTVVLPTMVVPVDTSGTEARAAIEAAQISAGADGASKGTPQVLLVPRAGRNDPAEARGVAGHRRAAADHRPVGPRRQRRVRDLPDS